VAWIAVKRLTKSSTGDNTTIPYGCATLSAHFGAIQGSAASHLGGALDAKTMAAQFSIRRDSSATPTFYAIPASDKLPDFSTQFCRIAAITQVSDFK
jgi:hypothetical protein